MAESIKRAGIILGILVALAAGVFAFSLNAPARAQDGTPHWIIELKDGHRSISSCGPAWRRGHVEAGRSS
jgi:peptidylprolyl isomerase